MSNIECITNNDILVVDSRLIASELEIQHKNLLETIRKYLTRIERFGVVTFETEKPLEGSLGGRPEFFCYLNEHQATLVMTMSRNTPKVVDCKVKLVQAFKGAKDKLAKSATNKLPQTYLEALKALVASEEEKELLKTENVMLVDENHQLAEAVDELFDYSSIIRVSKFNKISETNFNWRKLKALSLKMNKDIKQVPCPRFGVKNIYSHEVWRVAYPFVNLPETTTLVIQK